VVELKGFNAEEEESKGFFGFFKKQSNNIQIMKAKYDKAEVNVQKITEGLEVINRISECETGTNELGMSDVPVKPIVIKSIRID